MTPLHLRTLREERRPLLPERLLAKLWMAKAGRSLRTTNGRKLRVLYPGRPAPGHGPDFRDAVLEIDGQRISGPVERHRKPSDWRSHGHHLDAAYDNVILHVVSSRRGDCTGDALHNHHAPHAYRGANERE